MEFNSLVFAVFFIIFFFVYWALNPKIDKVEETSAPKLQNLWVLAASYLFYAWWDVRFLSLILLTTVSSFFFALLAQRRGKRLFTTINIVLNIGILIAFKYFNFFGENIALLLSAFGWNIGWIELDILLPVGISFYTFQAISYTVDTYRGDIKPSRDFISFACFVAFFPQLMAGPIERSKDLLPQMSRVRKWDYQRGVEGLREVLWGLFKKIALADTIAVFVNNLYGQEHDIFSPKWGVMAILFMLQIYFDFSAYSHIARGVAKMLGVNLTVNFRTPFFSSSMREYWRRWHISLMTWFRDYVYIPLGGSHKGKAKWIRNTLLVFLLSGIWHGASWNFVIWSLFIGLYIIVEKQVFSYFKLDYKRRMPLRIIVTVTANIYAMSMFRAEGSEQLINVVVGSLPWLCLAALAGIIIVRWWKFFSYILLCCCMVAVSRLVVHTTDTADTLALVLKFAPIFLAVLTLIVEWQTQQSDFALQHMWRKKGYRLVTYWALVFVIIFSVTDSSQFIYFQF